VGLRHLFTLRTFFPLMGKPCIEELDIAFIHASKYQTGPPKEDSTYGRLGDRVVYCFSYKCYLKKVVQCNLMHCCPLYFSEL